MRKVGYLDPFSLMAKGTVITTVFPDIGLLRFLLSPKTEMMSESKPCFTLKMPDCRLNLLVLPCGRSFSSVVGGFRVVTGKLTSKWAQCPRCAETPPEGW